MDDNREGRRHSEDFQDESGLELSLGLGLSSGDSRQKGPAIASPASSDLIGEPCSGSTLNGSHSSARHKPSNKASGLEAALKKFLEGRLDEQDENSKLLDGSSSFNQHQEKEKPMLASSHGSDKQPDLVSNMDNKGNPFVFKELQGSTGLATTRGQSSAHTTPLQLVDAFKTSPVKSSSGSPPSVHAVGHTNGNDRGLNSQENLDQHGKLQEAAKKRKHSNEEQKNHKKGKKEDEKPESHGFWKPGSSSMWVKGLDANAGNEAGEQLQQETSHDKESGDAESDGVDGPDMAPNAGADLGPNESRGPGGEVNFMSQLREQNTSNKESNHDDMWHVAMKKSGSGANLKLQGADRPFKGISNLPNSQKEGKASAHALGREGALQRQRERVPSETSTASTDGTEKMEEKSRGGGIGEASSSTPELPGSDKATTVVSAAMPFLPATATSSAALPFPMAPYSMASMPFSLPMSIPHAAGMPFPAGVNFPYLMQYLPPGSDGQDQNPIRPIFGSTYQPPPGMEYLTPHLSPLDGSSWMQAGFRPSAMAPFTNATNGSLYARGPMGVSEDANNRLQAPRVPDQGGCSQTADVSAVGNHPFFRTVANNGTHDPGGSSFPIPAVPHFSSQLALPDQGEPHSFKDQGGMKPFPGFHATLQAAQVSSGPARPPARSGVKEDGGLEQPRFGATTDNPALQQGPLRSSMETNNAGALGGHFHQGSTDNLSVMDGFGEDLPYLKRGIAPGLKFGGNGTPPDLPWVYTVGQNGRAIGGVVYRLSRNQLRVVCACHGKHMSPPEFAQHAESPDISGGERNTPNSSPITSQAN